ncbi:WbuC family cupin fold metalloprotein [Pseudomonas abieticivorans]|uniref:WbuC family cupin fold metalloprotein n=1 Tax=Pseudomonas abieticivorans TaxID=2931382 RepID=UPI0020C08249|nr:WbuC family cupin fold metalloprotein [Pseudomonas sp. PIA16]
MKKITPAAISALAAKAQQSPRLRANLNLHEQLPDPIQRLAIAMEPGTYVRMHRHPHTWELLHSLAGRFVVLNFDEAGVVTERVVLGEECAMVEIPAGVWHAVLSLDAGGVIFEVKHGPYTPIAEQDYFPGSPAEGDQGVGGMLDWYGTVRLGENVPA